MVSEWEFSGEFLLGADVVLCMGSLRGTGNSPGPGHVLTGEREGLVYFQGSSSPSHRNALRLGRKQYSPPLVTTN
jgi:hypothetical protein